MLFGPQNKRDDVESDLRISINGVQIPIMYQARSLGVILDIFCGTHDMPLRGKQADEGVLLDLLKLRIDSGDNKLKSHFEKCRRNAIYTSPRIQNELINLCGEVIQENVISEVRKTMAYSILADETADVSGKEQLSIGVRFYDESKSKIREEFVGFVELKAQNASAIAEAIDNFLISSNLSKEDCVGFGFDGCSTMAGKEGGVQAILRKKYPRALYFHCSSHKLNLVVNDANAVPEIRNTVATVKDVITFFRESTTRRNYAPNLSRLCETRWSEKYKSIRKFSQHFSELVKSLETLSVEGNYATRKSAYQLHSAVTKPVFIVSLQTIAKYSAVIEPVVNALQAKSIDMISVGKHIKNIKDILRNDREFPDRISNEILQKARAVAMDLNIEISVPRLAHKQTHRSNPPSDNDNEYWRRSLIIPYIDSLISSLNIRFSQENTPAFALSRLHPLYMTKTSIADLHKNAESFQEFYNLDITGELNLWHNLWVTKALSDDQLKDIEVVDLFKEANIFYPAVRKALIILSTIPCTTATVERSFSTLRRVKTWLRSTMGEERLTDMSRGDMWAGRSCCPLPVSESCRRACITATSSADLTKGCRQSDEIAFYNCLDRQQAGEDCCNQATNEDCQSACTDIFRSGLSSPSKLLRQRLKDVCELSSPKVTQCVKEIVKLTPVRNTQKHIQCCDKSNNMKCREACKQVLTTKNTIQEIIDGLYTGGCGLPMPQTFTKFWATSWDDFHYKCLTQVTEEGLRSCIDEVDEPCELGCDGLSFCTNFNNRPTELFRSCTSQADEAARNDVALWQTQNNITLVACTLQIKPCSRTSHANQICRDVCLQILTDCVDWTRLSPIYSAHSICEGLSPEDPDVSCLRLQKYLYPSTYKHSRITGEVSSPCRGNPCEPNEICLINRKCIHGINCKPYICQPGCKLGEVSQYMVPHGTQVRIPVTNNRKGWLKICCCSMNRIEECQHLPAITLTSCLLGNTQQLHGSRFIEDCNQCSCYAGEKVCSKKQCENSALSGRNAGYTTLPCNCPPHYVPVCARNGITYPSACLAKCADLNDGEFEHYPCRNPCKANMCPVGQKCVPKPQICLSLKHKPCKQYECINGISVCSNMPYDPVCDVENKQYDNSCLLAHHNAKLAYRGPCLDNCRTRGQVCGFNGQTYMSECAAHADMISVDYEGPCMAVGLIGTVKGQQCAGVRCPKLLDINCMGITPPGACCPVCGGALRLLYSRKQIDRALYALQNQSTESLNLKSLLKALERQIQIAQCTLKGYITVELDIFVLVHSTERKPSELQLEACLREAEKVASLINMQSPRIVSELSLSSLTAATIVHTQATAGASTTAISVNVSLTLFIVSWFAYTFL
nr:unnamed protein product [Callosobruchus analis]